MRSSTFHAVFSKLNEFTKLQHIMHIYIHGMTLYSHSLTGLQTTVCFSYIDNGSGLSTWVGSKQ